MITASDVWEDQLRTMCPHELPTHRAMYLTEDPANESQASRCIAYHCPGLDVFRESQLRDRGVWRGRGFAVGLPTPSLFWSLPENHRWAIILHEAAHFIEGLTRWRYGNDPVVRAYMEADSSRLMQPLTLPKLQPWDDHGLRWIRCAIHLHQRAAWHGWYTPIEFMTVAGQQYGLTDAHEYVAALGNEAHERRSESVEGILDSEPPNALLRLWQRDTIEGEKGGCGVT